eukprot:GILJ01012529.1.p1 GENE.GILJ01012529.1~~GILJ01012529.1.p1  ORF type:complete len:398 (+),score=51.96 GILJ01012529.1:78-1271(+)
MKGYSGLASFVFLLLTLVLVSCQSISFTSVPALNDFGVVEGRLSAVNVQSHDIAFYIFLTSWQKRPVSIGSGGTWSSSLSSSDKSASILTAYVVPKNVNTIVPSGLYSVPMAITSAAIASARTGRGLLSFAGYNLWKSQTSVTPVTPGPNPFSAGNVWVDSNGKMRLSIRKAQDTWNSAAVTLRNPLGFGTYVTQLEVDPTLWDPCTVLGIYTFESMSDAANNREHDLEISRFCYYPENVQFAVQPTSINDNRIRFSLSSSPSFTYVMQWSSGRVDFALFEGQIDSSRFMFTPAIKRFSVTGPRVYDANNAEFRMNLWMYRGNTTGLKQEQTVTISGFKFIKDMIPLGSFTADTAAGSALSWLTPSAAANIPGYSAPSMGDIPWQTAAASFLPNFNQ